MKTKEIIAAIFAFFLIIWAYRWVIKDFNKMSDKEKKEW